MEKYKSRDFVRWADDEGITDDVLQKILWEMSKGLLGDRLGADVYKKRIALPGRGKCGGARTIVIFRSNELVIFLYGYSKNEKSNLTPKELLAVRVLSKSLTGLPVEQRKQKVVEGTLVQIEEH